MCKLIWRCSVFVPGDYTVDHTQHKLHMQLGGVKVVGSQAMHEFCAWNHRVFTFTFWTVRRNDAFTADYPDLLCAVTQVKPDLCFNLFVGVGGLTNFHA